MLFRSQEPARYACSFVGFGDGKVGKTLSRQGRNKTSGESINQRGIVKAMGKLKGTALIVEGAGTIQPKRINEIVSCLNEETDRMIVIFED